MRYDSHGKELVRYVAELELGPSYGPDKGVRRSAATLDPRQLKPESTWYLATAFPLVQVSAEQVYELYRLREWIEHCYKPVKHEVGWADYQVRPQGAIVRHWQLVLLAYTCSLLVGALPTPHSPPLRPPPMPRRPLSRRREGEKSGPAPVRVVWAATLRGVRSWLCPWAPGPLGTAAALLDTVVERRPTARAGRAPRPRRPLPPH